MTFFYDLNKKLDSIRETPEVKHQQLNERDMSRAAKGYEKYGKQGMEALAKAGREGKSLDPIRDKYNKYDESMEESTGGYSAKDAAAGKDLGKPGKNFAKIAAKSGGGEKGKRIAGAVLNKLRHPSESVAEEGSAPMTAKQKSFAALAEPKDKITFADKIAGAKKEVDEVLGDVAATAMKKAISGHGSNKKPAADEGRIDDLMDKRREAGKLRQAEKPRARFVAGKAYGGSAQKDEPEHDDEEQAKSDAEKIQLNKDIESMVNKLPEFDSMETAKNKINEFIR